MGTHKKQTAEEGAGVAGLAKGLALLDVLAALGEVSAQVLAARAGIPRPTVHRLLQTLVAAGYVVQDAPRSGYRLDIKAHALAAGYRDEFWLSRAAGPVLAELRERVAWPIDLAICHGGVMVVCTGSHDQSPLSVVRMARGRRVPMVTSSMGKAYLAFCPASERDTLLESLERQGWVEWASAARRELFRRELEATRARGYSVRVRGVQPETSSIAVPVMHGERVIACISLPWISSVMTPEVAAEKFLAELHYAAQALQTAYAQYLRSKGQAALDTAAPGRF
jgi:IclR family mhp operon transcriptional activator